MNCPPPAREQKHFASLGVKSSQMHCLHCGERCQEDSRKLTRVRLSSQPRVVMVNKSPGKSKAH